jgi:V8-like Glu-specific endopeptidase
MKTTLFALMMMAMTMLMSCNDNGPAMDGLNLTMKATTSTSKISKSGRVQSGGYSFKTAMLGVREFEFETEGDDDNGDDDSEEVEFKGSYVVDLVAGTSSPEFVNGNLTPGFYDEFEIELGRTLANGNTMFFVFKYKPATGDSVSVEFSSKETLEFEFEDDNGFEVKEGTLKNFLVLINLDNLFNGVDLSNATVSDDGVIRINDTTNSSLASIVKNNLDKSCEGGDDDDDDDDIDDND